MKLYFIEQDDLDIIKTNLTTWAPNFKEPSPEWLVEWFKKEYDTCLLKESKYDIPDFKLDMSKEKEEQTDAENAQIIYENLKFLSDSQASDERLWAGLCIGNFWEYTQYRWRIKKKCTPDSIKQHYMFAYGVRRSLIRNAIARLWWIGRLTYDENRDDKYELTRFVCEHNDHIMHILERNTSNNPMIIQAFIDGILAARAEGLNINTDIVGDLSGYLNLLGVVYILDCLPRERIKEKILNKAREIAK